MRKPAAIIPYVVFLLFVVLSTFHLTSFPEPDTDESWDGAPAYSLITEGNLRNQVLRGREHYGEHVVRPRITLTLLVALAYKMLGVGLWQGRLVSVVFGAIALLATWWYTQKHLGAMAGLLASSFLATNGLMLHMTRMVRPEALETALTMMALCTLTHGIENGRGYHFFLAGLMGGVGLYTHAVMLFMTASFCVLLAARWQRKILARQEFWLFIVAVIIGAAPYVVYLWIEDAANGFLHFRAQLSQHARAVLSTEGWLLLNLQAEYRRYAGYVRFPVNLVPSVVAAASFALGLRSPIVWLRDLVKVAGTYAALTAIFIRSAMTCYLLPIVPMLSILEANLILSIPRSGRRRFGKEPSTGTSQPVATLAGFALACLVLANQLTRVAAWSWKYKDLDFPRFTAMIRTAVRPADKVWAPLELWPALYDHEMRSEFTYLREFPLCVGEVVADVTLREFPTCSAGLQVDISKVTFRPDLVILPQYAQHPRPHDCMRKIARYIGARTVRSFRDPYYGRTEILRLDWSNAPRARCSQHRRENRD